MKNTRREMVAVKPGYTVNVQAATTMTHIEPLQTPVRKHMALVMSESTMACILLFLKSSHVSCDACTKPFPYAAICNVCSYTKYNSIPFHNERGLGRSALSNHILTTIGNQDISSLNEEFKNQSRLFTLHIVVCY